MVKPTVAPDVAPPPGHAATADVVASALTMAPAARAVLEASELRLNVCSRETAGRLAGGDTIPFSANGLVSSERADLIHCPSAMFVLPGARTASGWQAQGLDAMVSTLNHEAVHVLRDHFVPEDRSAALAVIRSDGAAFIAAVESTQDRMNILPGRPATRPVWQDAVTAFARNRTLDDPRALGDVGEDALATGMGVISLVMAESSPGLVARVGCSPGDNGHYWRFAVRLANLSGGGDRPGSPGGNTLEGQRRIGAQVAAIEDEALAHFVEATLQAKHLGKPVDPRRAALALRIMAGGTANAARFADKAFKAFTDVARRSRTIMARDGTEAILTGLNALAVAAVSDPEVPREVTVAAGRVLLAAAGDAGARLGRGILAEMQAEIGREAAVSALSLAGGQVERWMASGRGGMPVSPEEAARTAAILAGLPALPAALSAAMDQAETQAGRPLKRHFGRDMGAAAATATLALHRNLHGCGSHPARARVAATINMQAVMAAASGHLAAGRAAEAASFVREAAGWAVQAGQPGMVRPLKDLADSWRGPGSAEPRLAVLGQAWHSAFPCTTGFQVSVTPRQAAILAFRDPAGKAADGLRGSAAAAADAAVEEIFRNIEAGRTDAAVREMGGLEPVRWLMAHPNYAGRLASTFWIAAQGAASALRTGIAGADAMRGRLRELHTDSGLDRIRSVLRAMESAPPTAVDQARACSAGYAAARQMPLAQRMVASTILWNRMAAVLLSADEQKTPLASHDLNGILTLLRTMRGELPPAVAAAAGTPVATAERMLEAANAMAAPIVPFGKRIDAYRRASRLAEPAHTVAMRI